MKSNTEDVLQWLPDQSVARTNYNLFREHFGSDDFLIVSWTGCSLEDERLGQFSRQLTAEDRQGLIESVTTGADVARRLRSQMKLSDAEIRKRLRGVFFGYDHTGLTCALVELSPEGTAHRTDAMRFVWKTVDTLPGLTRADVSVGGYPYVATYVDQQLRNSFRYFLIPSVLLATLVALSCLRNIVLTSIVFVAAVGAAAVSTAFVPVCGAKMGGLMSIIPASGFRPGNLRKHSPGSLWIGCDWGPWETACHRLEAMHNFDLDDSHRDAVSDAQRFSRHSKFWAVLRSWRGDCVGFSVAGGAMVALSIWSERFAKPGGSQ